MSRRRKQIKEPVTAAQLAAECIAAREAYFREHGEYPSVSREEAARWGAETFAAMKPELDENQRRRDESMALARCPGIKLLLRRRRRRNEE